MWLRGGSVCIYTRSMRWRLVLVVALASACESEPYHPDASDPFISSGTCSLDVPVRSPEHLTCIGEGPCAEVPTYEQPPYRPCDSTCSSSSIDVCLTLPGCQALYMQHRYGHLMQYACSPTLGGVAHHRIARGWAPSSAPHGITARLT
jgi:hypothetical protein